MILLLTATIAAAAVSSGEAFGTAWYVGPQGSPTNDGSKESPWDIASALVQIERVQPGDTIYLMDGVYRRRPNELFEVMLVGAEGRPVHVRPEPGARVVIDGGLTIQPPTAHLWMWDLEILVSEPRPARIISPGSHPEDLTRPAGGLNMRGGDRCKFINLVIHDCSQGVSWWVGSKDSELHGCLIYDNGWLASDRGHGHAIYTQNDDGVKTISDCIMTGGYSYTMHAYGSSRAFVNNYLIEGNVCYDAGTFLIGGGRPSHGIVVAENVLYGMTMRLGYDAPHNEDCVARDNLIVNGALQINRFNEVSESGNVVLSADAPRPDAPQVILRRNKYDQNRAHVVLLNWDGADSVEVDFDGFLDAGEAFRLMDPRLFYAPPIMRGTYDGSPITVPVEREMTVFVVLKG
ncbi:MAG: right-handed parallel beta-helix repeat-containing protein [Candidatus Poribacteria bacterium]|nr:right-handed parallel beta-helix repeat-containing protein [Candidatus Poribacteria bacterium]